MKLYSNITNVFDIAKKEKEKGRDNKIQLIEL